MKRIPPLLSLLLVLWMAVPSLAQIAPAGPKPVGTYYVIAPNGLNIREAARGDSKKLATLPYGARVTLTDSAVTSDMTVDHISGGMAKVEREGVTGYAFDGYLSRFPAPEFGQETAAYVEAIRQADFDVYHESISRDWGGYLQQEEAIVLRGEAWEEAFLIARQLYRLPPKLLFPAPGKETEQKIPNPDKESYAWTDEMTVTRKPDGRLLTITYSFRSEGGGRHVSIQYLEEENGLRISEVQIAD